MAISGAKLLQWWRELRGFSIEKFTRKERLLEFLEFAEEKGVKPEWAELHYSQIEAKIKPIVTTQLTPEQRRERMRPEVRAAFERNEQRVTQPRQDAPQQTERATYEPRHPQEPTVVPEHIRAQASAVIQQIKDRQKREEEERKQRLKGGLRCADVVMAELREQIAAELSAKENQTNG